MPPLPLVCWRPEDRVISSAYENIIAKLERSHKHISDLRDCWAAAQEAHPSEAVSHSDPDTGQTTYYLGVLTPIPPEYSLIAGDAIQNLRSSLDHLVYAMVSANGGVPSTLTAFPIAESAAEYADPKGRVPRQVKGMRELAIQALDRIKPYKGGNESLWILHKLNNIDKHRLLITVGIRATGHTILPREERALLAMYLFQNPGAAEPAWRGGIFAMGPSANDPILKPGDVLLTVPTSEARQNMQFSVDVAFAETGVARGVSVALTLDLIYREVSRIVRDFACFL